MTELAAQAVRLPVSDGRQRHGLTVVTASVAVGVVWANAAAVGGCLPAIAANRGASEVALQWVANVYPLALVSLLLPAGTFLDRFGRRRGLVLGLVVLLLGEVGCAAAPTTAWLIGARVVCGIGAAVVFPATLATITSTLPPDRRDRGVSMWTMSSLLGSIVGLIAAVALIEVVRWQWVFVVMGGVTFLCLLTALAAVPETYVKGHVRLDRTGAALALVGPGGLVAGATSGPVQGWLAPVTVGGFVVGAVASVLFVWHCLRAAHPLLDLGVYRNRMVAGSSIALFTAYVGALGLFFLIFQARQYAFGDTPLVTALIVCSGATTMVPAIFLGPPLTRRYGLRAVVTTGLIVCTAGMGELAAAGSHAGIARWTVGICVFWAGLGLAMTPTTQGIIRALPDADHGMASALNDIVRELGAVAGIAVLGAAFNAGYRSRVPNELQDSPGAAIASLAHSGGPGVSASLQSVHAGVVHGWQLAITICAAQLLLGALFAFVYLPHHRRGVI